MGWSSTLDECKECSPKKLNKECMKSNLKTLRHTGKRLLYADGRRQLPVHNKSMVKILYNRDIISE
jgi:hypothetical protein